ncbi:hypothetical protein [Chiayiivirga flava]|uniref:Uncharacterized protein n=1 Tax=Chiayiivirga flava TaxID=659595 RepID=A0A7W8G050_9GAMM|nr:hypothetical protein [Chiayiivirga flava]MBB5207353.1 hypothetical protein [Chiayiivirga flava]
MGRTVLAVVLGIVAAGLVVAGIEAIGHALNPPPPGIDPSDPAAMQSLIANLPQSALVTVVLAWALGSIAGGFVAAKISRRHTLGAPLAVGIAMVLLIGVNFVAIPHPAWMMVCGVLLPVPLAAWVGRRIAAI